MRRQFLTALLTLCGSTAYLQAEVGVTDQEILLGQCAALSGACLLYTSDAADDM
jgi:hypothetical protein